MCWNSKFMSHGRWSERPTLKFNWAQKQALGTCDELERKFGALIDDDEIAFGWRAKGTKTKALLARGNHADAMETLHAVYAAFTPNNETMMREMLRRLIELIAIGISESELVEILSSDRKKSKAMEPLGIALRMRTGVTFAPQLK